MTCRLDNEADVYSVRPSPEQRAGVGEGLTFETSAASLALYRGKLTLINNFFDAKVSSSTAKK